MRSIFSGGVFSILIVTVFILRVRYEELYSAMAQPASVSWVQAVTAGPRAWGPAVLAPAASPVTLLRAAEHHPVGGAGWGLMHWLLPSCNPFLQVESILQLKKTTKLLLYNSTPLHVFIYTNMYMFFFLGCHKSDMVVHISCTTVGIVFIWNDFKNTFKGNWASLVPSTRYSQEFNWPVTRTISIMTFDRLTDCDKQITANKLIPEIWSTEKAKKKKLQEFTCMCDLIILQNLLAVWYSDVWSCHELHLLLQWTQ